MDGIAATQLNKQKYTEKSSNLKTLYCWINQNFRYYEKPERRSFTGRRIPQIPAGKRKKVLPNKGSNLRTVFCVRMKLLLGLLLSKGGHNANSIPCCLRRPSGIFCRSCSFCGVGACVGRKKEEKNIPIRDSLSICPLWAEDYPFWEYFSRG